LRTTHILQQFGTLMMEVAREKSQPHIDCVAQERAEAAGMDVIRDT